MINRIVVPELGEGITKAVVSFWYFKVGDRVKEDDDIVELTTDKATFNISTEKPGVLKKILASEGREVKIGEHLAVIE